MSENGRTTLWLTDRTRYETALDRCQRARYLEFHWGPAASGITRKATSVPLMTGIALHRAGEHLDGYAKHYDQPAPDSVVRDAVDLATAEYERVVTLRGVRDLDQSERVETIVAEQKALIAGLTWAYALQFQPWLLEHSTIVDVEHEEVMVLACTCGLGDRIGTKDDHEARGCQGIGWQARADLVTEYRSRKGVYAYWERKSTSQTGERWSTEWETKIQFTATAKAAEARLGLPISEAWVIGLIKGRRAGDYNPETGRYDGPMRQQSPLCYGYRRPANPPLEAADWQATREYQDEQGVNRRLGRAYQRTGIWQIIDDMPEVAASGFSIPEFWAKWIPPAVLGDQLAIVGPLQINQILSDEFFEEVVAEERRWQERIWTLFDTLEGDAQGDWLSEPFQRTLRELVPRSWSCRRFGKRYACQFEAICHQHEGFTDPVGSGTYVPRRPHHAAELKLLEERGLVPEGGWADEQEDPD
jgi:hypothetical protein